MNPKLRPYLRSSAWVLFLTLAAIFVTTGREDARELPTVSWAAVPTYPHLPLSAGIQGMVKIRVVTDGKTIKSMTSEMGHPLLVEAAQENLRTWRFEPHTPTTFTVTFSYKIEEESSCRFENGTVILHLPSDIQIQAKGIRTCDPEK